VNFFVAGLGSAPPGPTARTWNVYLPLRRCLYVFGVAQRVNLGLGCLRVTSAHWNPVAVPVAVKLNVALWWRAVIFA
jgi:hypothetical protein